MVSLTRLTLQGFKSFRNKTSIEIGSGITCIAGANGSGKSNLLDAFSFVLGRSSAKVLRADKMEEVIFKSDKGQSQSAKVELEFENNDRAIGIDSDTVTVYRQVNQNGQSTYKLNGKIETRQRILDLLRGARISPEGLNIVAQGDVTHVIEMTPLDRRKVIDELAGLAEFDEKKKKSEGELEKVETILKEQSLLLGEKEKIFTNISEEKRKVEMYEELSEKVKRAKFSIAKIKLDECTEKRNQITERSSEFTGKLSKVEEDIQKIDREIEAVEEDTKKITKSVFKGSREVEVIEKQEKLKSQLMSKEARLRGNEREIERLKSYVERLEEVEKPRAVKFLLDKEGVLGTPDQIIRCSPDYREAIDAALSAAKNNIIVDTVSRTESLIRYLKENRIGTAKFLPLDKIRGGKIEKPQGEGVVDVAMNLVKYDSKYYNVVEFLLGSTLVMDSIRNSKALINRYRMATIDGSLIEKSGAVLGGYKEKAIDTGKSRREISALEEENKKLNEELKNLAAELSKVSKSRDEVKGEYSGIGQKLEENEAELKKLREERRKAYERKLRIQSDMSNENIKIARLDVEIKTAQEELSELEVFEETEEGTIPELKEMVSRYTREISELGALNMKSVEDFETYRNEYESLKEKVEKIVEEKYAILKVIMEIESHRKDSFMELFRNVDSVFREIYNKFTEGEGYLELEETDNVYSGLMIKARPKGKRLLGIDSLSGGEKTITAIAFLLSIQRCKPSCFCLLDEIDAALDRENTRKVIEIIQEFTDDQQYVIITHNEVTISKSNQVYGVISENGISSIVGIRLSKREETLR
ncbi:MAG: chromosome segregation SMC family protein [Candidatus Aenigmatarchaeota archaeon]